MQKGVPEILVENIAAYQRENPNLDLRLEKKQWLDSSQHLTMLAAAKILTPRKLWVEVLVLVMFLQASTLGRQLWALRELICSSGLLSVEASGTGMSLAKETATGK